LEHVDVSLSSIKDYNYSNDAVWSWNHPNIDYMGEPVFPERLQESQRFIWAALLSWLFGVFVITIAQEIVLGMLQAMYFNNERKRLNTIILEAQNSKRDPLDLSADKAIMFLLLNPKVLLVMDSSKMESGENSDKCPCL